MALHEAVAEEVRVLLTRRQIKQNALADQLGWTPWYLGRRLKGQTPFDVRDLEALASVLDVEPADFFPRETVRGGVVNQRYLWSAPPSGKNTLRSRVVSPSENFASCHRSLTAA
jgi:transcriptional regulator with XRE-family HTH domain